MEIITVGYVAEINEVADRLLSGVRRTIADAIELGGMLEPVKAQFIGQWSKWLKENTRLSVDTADRCIALWANPKKLPIDKIGSLTEAYKLLGKPDEEDVKTPAPQEEAKPSEPAQADLIAPPPVAKGKPKPPVTARAVKAADVPDEPLDEIGRPIPDEVLPLWNRQQEVQDLLTVTGKLRTALRKAQNDNDILFVDVRFSDSISRLDTIYYNLRCCMPYAVCPYCQGKVSKDCKFCSGRGFIGKDLWDGPIPAELKELCLKEAEKRRAINV